MDILQRISDIGLVPVVKIDNAKDALPLAKALINGGLPCAEITFRTAAAEDAIKSITEAYPDMLVGAGTVLTTQQADRAIQAGAKFIVSPGLNRQVVEHCLSKGYLILPGVCTPSDVEVALSLGLNAVKFFPAQAAGGLPMIKAMSAPYSGVKFMPTGGINSANLKSYLDFNKIIACGGSWMVSSDLINSGDFDTIEQKTRDAVNEMLGFELGHIGINSDNQQQALAVANMFKNIFGFNLKEIPVSYFAGGSIEVMKNNGYGEKGHIAILTNYLSRAVSYLKGLGIELDEDSKIYNDKGELILIYLAESFGGFAIHLSQKH